MLLFDESRVIEKAIGEDATRMLANVFARYDERRHDELATKGDLELTQDGTVQGYGKNARRSRG